MNNIPNAAYDDAYKALRTVAVGSGNSTPTTMGDGSKNVTTAGTALALASSTTCIRVDITAKLSNTGLIVVGASTVVATSASRRGIPLSPGDTISLTISDLATVFIDSTVSGEGVTYLYTV